MFDDEHFTIENFEAYKRATYSILEVARQLKADIYFASEDLERLAEKFAEISGMEGFDEYIQSPQDYLEILFRDAIPHTSRSLYFEIVFNEKQSSLAFYSGSKCLHCETDANHVVISRNLSGEDNLLKIDSENEFEKVKINYFHSNDLLWKFINSMLPKRIYHFSSKHGNIQRVANSPKKSEQASRLKCSDEEAQNLLDNAIFDLRETPWCYIFDDTVDTYLVFPFEGDNPQNQYHAFHLEDEKQWNKVPKSIREFFKK
ncbi:hypothetical protein [Cellulophaga sp. BC115SP]|uniref:hypothetical protein n=1 Tax=Cellulophaga sp. BC115SP TaxID=2683263 RepID=UPI0014123F77|nr:hypothetical protein [Cellulophaga sp. BC115SP]NBB30249.1 hypothetical protein [Cellulophaga sp. BC115SP]